MYTHVCCYYLLLFIVCVCVCAHINIYLKYILFFSLNRVMPSNVEIKAKVSNPDQFAGKAASLSQSEGTIIRQHDTFFEGARGRLKLRDFMVL